MKIPLRVGMVVDNPRILDELKKHNVLGQLQELGYDWCVQAALPHIANEWFAVPGAYAKTEVEATALMTLLNAYTDSVVECYESFNRVGELNNVISTLERLCAQPTASPAPSTQS